MLLLLYGVWHPQKVSTLFDALAGIVVIDGVEILHSSISTSDEEIRMEGS